MNKFLLILIFSVSLVSCATNTSLTQADKEVLTSIAIQYTVTKTEFKNKKQVSIVVSNLKTIIESGTFDRVLIDNVIDDFLANSKLNEIDRITVKTLISLVMSKVTININIEPAEYKRELVVYLNTLLEALK
jgi:hypothetical protein